MIWPTGRGWALLVAGLAALIGAYALGHAALLVPAVMLLGLLIVSAVTMLPVVSSAQPVATLPDDVREGGTAVIRVAAGERFTGGWFRMRSPVTSRWSAWSDLGAGRGTVELVDLPRGVHPMPRIRVRAADRFGIWRLTRQVPHAGDLAIGPAVTPLSAAVRSGFGSFVHAMATGVSDQVDQLVREHRREDGMRRVHWKQSAKHDRLMTRKEEPPSRGTATVVLDTIGASHRDRDELDDIVRTFASIVVGLQGSGIDVRVVETGERQLPPEAGELSERALVEALARVDAAVPRKLAPPGRGERVHVVTGAAPDAAVLDLVGSLGRADAVWGASPEVLERSIAERLPLIGHPSEGRK